MKWIGTKPNPYYYWILDSARHDDIYDAIICAVERETNMNEKKAKEGFFDELYKKLDDMGIVLTEIRQDSWNDCVEITGHLNPFFIRSAPVTMKDAANALDKALGGKK